MPRLPRSNGKGRACFVDEGGYSADEGAYFASGVSDSVSAAASSAHVGAHSGQGRACFVDEGGYSADEGACFASGVSDSVSAAASSAYEGAHSVDEGGYSADEGGYSADEGAHSVAPGVRPIVGGGRSLPAEEGSSVRGARSPASGWARPPTKSGAELTVDGGMAHA